MTLIFIAIPITIILTLVSVYVIKNNFLILLSSSCIPAVLLANMSIFGFHFIKNAVTNINKYFKDRKLIKNKIKAIEKKKKIIETEINVDTKKHDLIGYDKEIKDKFENIKKALFILPTEDSKKLKEELKKELNDYYKKLDNIPKSGLILETEDYIKLNFILFLDQFLEKLENLDISIAKRQFVKSLSTSLNNGSTSEVPKNEIKKPEQLKPLTEKSNVSQPKDSCYRVRDVLRTVQEKQSKRLHTDYPISYINNYEYDYNYKNNYLKILKR